MQPTYVWPNSSNAYTNGHARFRQEDGWTTLSQWTSQRRHSSSSCGRSGSSAARCGWGVMTELSCSNVAAARLDRGRLFLLGPGASSQFAGQPANDVEHVDLCECSEVGLDSVLVLLRAKPHRLHGSHPDVAGAAHVCVEPVADEQTPIGGDAEPVQREQEDLGPRFPQPDLRREDRRVESF